jgi:hypothetical protein
MTDLTATVVCSNTACRVAETTKCVEGIALDKCPHYGRTPQAAPDEPEDAEGVRLASGSTLSISEAEKLLRAGETRVIAVIGPSDAGKTSLIAGFYDLFQERAVAGVEFAGSRSLHELEHVCHDARAASQRGTPHINRTPLGEVRFYHLDVAGGDAGELLSLVLADRAGEEYRSAIDDVSFVAGFPEVHRADTLTLLVDGERLLDPGARHNLRNEVILMLRAMIEGGAIQSGMRLAIVLTKKDLINGSQRQVGTEADFANLVATIERRFGAIFSAIQSFRVAASPKSDAVRRGEGIDELLTYWLGQRTILPSKVEAPPLAHRVFARLRLTEEAEDAEDAP